MKSVSPKKKKIVFELDQEVGVELNFMKSSNINKNPLLEILTY